MEYEIKLRLRSVPDLSKFKKLGEVVEEDVYFNHPCRDFAKTDEALRVRVMYGDKEANVLTYKGPRVKESQVKVREELEVEIDDAKTMEKILQRLGFKPVARIRKRREVYEVDGAYVTIDRVEGLGLFMEIEGKDEEHVLSVWRKLDVDGEVEKRTYLELFLLHHGSALRHVKGEVDERSDADEAGDEEA